MSALMSFHYKPFDLLWQVPYSRTGGGADPLYLPLGKGENWLMDHPPSPPNSGVDK